MSHKNHQIAETPWYDQILVVLIFLLIPALIFLYSTAVYTVFTSPKLFALRILSLLILVVFAWKTMKEKQITFVSPKFYLFLSAYGLVSIINTIITVNLHTSLFGIPERFLGLFTTLNFLLVAFFTAQILNKKNLQKFFIQVFVVFGAIASIYGIFQYYGLVGDPSTWDQDPTQRVFGTFGHANHFGAFLGVNTMLALGLSFSEKNNFLKCIYGLIALLSFITIFDTASRGALGAILISVIFFIVHFGYLNYPKIKKYYFNLTVAFLIGVILIIVSNSIWLPKLKNSFLFTRIQTIEENYEKGFIPDRVSWWFSMLEMIKDKPVFGYGLSTFKEIYSQYRRLDYRNPDDLQYEIEPEAGHMEYLNIAATQGLVGLATYLLPIIYVFYLAYKKIKNSENCSEQFIIIGLLSALVAYLTQVLISFGVVSTWSLFFILLGLTISYVTIDDPVKFKVWDFKPKIEIIIFILALLIFIIGSDFSVNQLRVEFWRRQAERAAVFKDYPKVKDALEQVVELEPANAYYYADYGDFLVKLSVLNELADQKALLLKEAIVAYEKTIKLNNLHPHFFANLGLASLNLADFYQNSGNQELVSQYLMLAIKAYEEAVVKGPNNPLHLYNLMKVYAITGQFDKFFETGDKILAMRKDYKDTLKLLTEVAKANKN
ncbi:hypothetical protein A2272_06060 [Candidatus Peregrinibacteria bacterium RIFOXYA12_FULL_33_12]|nr:MAG: hypothetical protein A2272_06060 [Candidatus Peregrinibacteria bacterium RIFOXYA12_FULL_33_12]OGJ49969.1 MAG: hypothetical protein A2307_03755 [Candidatus Peregrinibacteria bacterium RIFOXYB2_FULL_33_20]